MADTIRELGANCSDAMAYFAEVALAMKAKPEYGKNGFCPPIGRKPTLQSFHNSSISLMRIKPSAV